jgi:protoheme IX farnesyltransferase
MRTITSYLILCRVLISLVAACSAATGFLLAASAPQTPALLTALGVFLLACGASALNQYQERDIDARMERTKHRPLPAGVIAPGRALAAGAVLVLSGTAALASRGGMTALLGILAVIWYNGLYTPLKRRTAFAALYGAPVGMLPPAIGWTSGGGSLADPRLFVLAALFLLWQVPHFWLLLLHNGDDYRRAGLPTVTAMVPRDRLAAISSVWIASTATAALALPLFGLLRDPLLFLVLILAGVVMTLSAVVLQRRNGGWLATVTVVDAYLFVLLMLLSADVIVRQS